jgi:GH35 family endo-1,4-beta-xylanase
MFSNVLAFVTLATAVSAAFVPEERAKTPAPLAAAAAPRYFGAAIGLGHLTNASDPRYQFLAQSQFSGVTPENEMKWSVNRVLISTHVIC